MSLQAKVTVRAFFGMTFVLSTIAVVGFTVLVWAQGPADVTRATTTTQEHLIISEDIMFSWPIVIMIVTSAVGYAGVVYSVNQHHKDARIHLDCATLLTMFRPKGECEIIHQSLATGQQEIKEALVEIRQAQKDR